MIKLEDLSWPITFRYNLATSWGISSQELTFDIPAFEGHLPEAFAFAASIWRATVALQLAASCEVSFIEAVQWKQSPVPMLGASGVPFGQQHGQPSPRNSSGVIMLHNGYTDSYARRKFYLPDIPVVYQTDRVLTPAGQNGLYAMCCALFMGSMGDLFSGPFQWLMAFPRVFEQTPANLLGVGFRKPVWLRICSYCNWAPDAVPLDWP